MYEVSKAVKIPIIGIGGIMTGEDAVEFLLAGATAVQVGTASFINPSAGVNVAAGLRSFGEKQGLSDIGQLVGAMESNVGVSILQSWL